MTTANSYFNFIDKEKLHLLLSSGEFPFSPYLFWDTEVSAIDLKKHKRYIIERVLMKGKLEDVYLILKIYSTSEIKEAIKQSKELDAKTAHFCSLHFGIPLNEIHVSSFYS